MGEIVLIGSENTKRSDWPVGRVIEVCAGKDGINRVAKIKTKHGVLVRPLQRLFPLEVSNKVSVENNIELKKATVEDSITERRSR